MELIQDEQVDNISIDSNQLEKIRVVGVGGAGGNAINLMASMKLKHVSLIACNTDSLALSKNLAHYKICLGQQLSKGLGAGNEPSRGRDSAIESTDEIKKVLEGADIVFVSAGMGGGTGTGAAPIIARIAKDLDALTIAVVTIPEKAEGKKRLRSVVEGITELYKNVDALLIVNCDMMMDYVDPNWTMHRVRKYIDEVLVRAVQSVTHIATRFSTVQIDINDVRSAMKDSGICYIGMGVGNGINRAKIALEDALHAPLLRNQNIKGAHYVLANTITNKSKPIEFREHNYVLNTLSQKTGLSVLDGESQRDNIEGAILWGETEEETMSPDDDTFYVIVIVTGYKKGLFVSQKKKDLKDGKMFIDKNGTISFRDNDVVEQEETEDLDFEAKLRSLYILERDEEQTKEKLVETHAYSDPVILSEDALLDENILYDFENIPAYERRNKKES